MTKKLKVNFFLEFFTKWKKGRKLIFRLKPFSRIFSYFLKEDHGLHSSVDASYAISGAKKSQTWDLVWVTGGPQETIFVKTFFQNSCRWTQRTQNETKLKSSTKAFFSAIFLYHITQPFNCLEIAPLIKQEQYCWILAQKFKLIN